MRRLAILLLAFLPAWVAAEATQISGVRSWGTADSARIVFDLSAPVKHRMFVLSSPARVVVDIAGAEFSDDLDYLQLPVGPITAVRASQQDGGDWRVVFDLAGPVESKSFLLTPNPTYGHRLVLDLNAKLTVERDDHGLRSEGRIERPRNVVIAIDAGHGGVDPGAIGPKGTREKDVVLGVARQLAALIDKERGMRAVLVRDGDQFISLRERTRIARRSKADLFISIHADAFRDRRASGSSVYILSERGASSEAARWLAESENAADLLGGLSLDDKDEVLASVLLDLSQAGSIDASVGVANRVLAALGRVGSVHKRHVEQAGFAVLKAPDIPSILVETAFISNPQEERRLRDPAHQRKLAQAILGGVREYFVAYAPPGTVLAMNEPTHVIVKGDTLSAIAQQYQVSLKDLRLANALSNDILQVGKVLRIPVGGDS